MMPPPEFLAHYVVMMGAALRDSINPVVPWLTQYGAWTVFVGLFLETSVLTGPVAPGFGILVAAGYLAAAGVLSVWQVALAACAGGLLGDQASYWLARWLGTRLLGRLEPQARQLEYALEDEGRPLLVWYHYSPLLRALLPTAAGAVRYDLRTWMKWDALGVAGWTWVMIAIGWLAHESLQGGDMVVLFLNSVVTIATLVASWRIASRVKRRARVPEAETAS